MKNQKKVLVTGVAGFIGAHVAQLLIRKGFQVIGVDDLNAYYDVRLKKHRLNVLRPLRNFQFRRASILDLKAMSDLFQKHRFHAVLNLAAQAGVACSVGNPFAYLSANVVGTLNLLELAKGYGVKKFLLSSTSSLYTGHLGPFKEDFECNTPFSPYAASKKSAEAFCHSYHHLYGIDMIIARYFTVYGPAGRPDMAPFKFIHQILNGKPVTVYGNGNATRDFTYIDDIAEGTAKALRLGGFHVLNFGGDRPIRIRDFIRKIEGLTGKKAQLKFTIPIKADAANTWADISAAKRILKWKPKVSLEEGLKRTIAWYQANGSWASKLKPGYNPDFLNRKHFRG